MKLSIIIPMYKVEQFIEKCIISCCQQDLPKEDYEIICVNDGSPDNSLSIAEGLAGKFSNIRCISRKNGGLSAARNTGIENATGDYIMFLDSDDWIESNCLSKIITKCEAEQLDMLRICAANMIGDKPVRRFSYSNNSIRNGLEVMSQGMQVCAPFSIYKRAFINKHGLRFYEGIFHEDNEFTPRAFFFASRVNDLNDIVYFVYQNPNSITRSVNPKKVFDYMLVIERLDNFAKSNGVGDSTAFHHQIAQCLNGALNETLSLEKNDVERFDNYLSERCYLLDYLKSSGELRLKIEWLLLRIAPKHVSTIYKIFIKLDPRKFNLR